MNSMWIDLLLPILSILIPVFTTIYTVNSRVENENKETHKPYLVLKKVDEVQRLNSYHYYLTIFGRNIGTLYPNLSEEEIIKQSLGKELPVKLVFRNIGYGVATNIKFYDLLTGNEIKGAQDTSENQNQKLFTTFDIASDEEKEVQAKIITISKEEEHIYLEDHNRIICIYQDLNNHVYNFIFSINVKSSGHYDFFAYQRSSRSYKKWMKENKKQYQKILSKYSHL